MPKAVLTALAAAIILGIPAGRAEAITAAAPSALGAAAAPAPFFHKAAVVCGAFGCNPVHTKAQRRRKFQPLGYTKPIQQGALPPKS